MLTNVSKVHVLFVIDFKVAIHAMIGTLKRFLGCYDHMYGCALCFGASCSIFLCSAPLQLLSTGHWGSQILPAWLMCINQCEHGYKSGCIYCELCSAALNKDAIEKRMCCLSAGDCAQCPGWKAALMSCVVLVCGQAIIHRFSLAAPL